MMEFLISIPVWAWMLILVWDLVWRSLALWRSARNDQKAWFVCLAIFNTVGILPIIYLLINRRRQL